jgi:arginyl-tRNA--protein-N-Asp/Glu arginylyltransferase
MKQTNLKLSIEGVQDAGECLANDCSSGFSLSEQVKLTQENAELKAEVEDANKRADTFSQFIDYQTTEHAKEIEWFKAEVERLREILAEMVDAFPFLHNLKQTDAAILACKALGRIKEDGRE